MSTHIVRGIIIFLKTQVAVALTLTLTLSGCYDEQWFCLRRGNNLISMSESGRIAGASKACNCTDLRAFERERFGYVDEEALRRDFGCGQ